jgi:mono/diheme cytochrome c family protein
MLKNLFLTVMAAAIAAGAFAASVGHADKSTSKVSIPAQKTTPVSGKQIYGHYCAPCHGVTGGGNGPVAAELKTRPTDLTMLSRNNGGKFPSAHVTTVLQYGVKIPSHGTAEMPVWGPVLGKMDQANPQERLLRISNLSHYLETIQVK